MLEVAEIVSPYLHLSSKIYLGMFRRPPLRRRRKRRRSPAMSAQKETAIDFVNGCVRHAPGKDLWAKELYEALKTYCLANSRQVPSQRQLGLVLAGRQFKKHKYQCMFYLDIELQGVLHRSNERRLRLTDPRSRS
jgi:hypothetical protein